MTVIWHYPERTGENRISNRKKSQYLQGDENQK